MMDWCSGGSQRADWLVVLGGGPGVWAILLILSVVWLATQPFRRAEVVQ
jgi:hypothetical protein